MFSVEKNIPFSQSFLWQAQKEYFEKAGIDAWSGQVPFFVTSNPFIAECYAKLIAAYLRDLIQDQSLDPSEPVYIFELGAGSGQFSFYCLQALKREFATLPLCYVMTDFTESNIVFWEQQEAFKSIDFAQFDLENPQPIFLRRQKRELSLLKNPCILIGNYIFDSIRQDFYGIEAGKLVEKHIETFVPLEDYDFVRKGVKSIHQAQIEESSKAYMWKGSSEESYLRFYQGRLRTGVFSLPLSGFKALDFFKAMAPKGLMLISSDKGYNTLTELEACNQVEWVTHGSFSLEVNFHAISLYFQALGGQAKLQSYREGVKTNVFLLGPQVLPHFDQVYEEYCEGFSPADYFQYHRRLQAFENPNLEFILSQIIFSRFDPYIFSLYIDQIRELIKTTVPPTSLIEAYCRILPKLEVNIYPIPKGMDHYFNLGLFLHSLKRYQEAIPYFEKSLLIHGDSFEALHNLDICKAIVHAY